MLRVHPPRLVRNMLRNPNRSCLFLDRLENIFEDLLPRG